MSIEGGLAAYTAARPAVVLITSAAAERNAVIGDDVALRAADIPIVQLNPAGSLNWKYKGEVSLRESGLACATTPWWRCSCLCLTFCLGEGSRSAL